MLFHVWYWFKRKTPSSYRPVILVTGCGSGIGLALAFALHKIKAYRVVVTARERSLGRLRDHFQDDERFWVRPLDVTSASDRSRLLAEIQNKWNGVDILINNAGISYRAVLEHMTDEDEYRQMATNYFGPVALTRAVIPHMRLQGRGKIINVSSVSGMLAMPTMASYSASKHALEGMSEALWYEMKPLGINVSLIQPGFVHSNSFKNVYFTPRSRPDRMEEGVYADYYAAMAPFVARLMNLSLTSPNSIASLALKLIRTEHPPLWVPATWDAVVFYYLRRFVPRRILLPLLFLALPKARRWGERYSKKRA
jgi:hypothetical protein